MAKRALAFRKGVKPEIVQDAITASIVDVLTPDQIKAARKSDDFRQIIREIGLKTLMRTSQSDDPWVLRVAQEMARTLLMDVQHENQMKVAADEVANRRMAYERELLILQERVHAYLHTARSSRPPGPTISQSEWLDKITPLKGISEHGEDAHEEPAALETGTNAEEEGMLIDGRATVITDDSGDV